MPVQNLLSLFLDVFVKGLFRSILSALFCHYLLDWSIPAIAGTRLRVSFTYNLMINIKFLLLLRQVIRLIISSANFVSFHARAHSCVSSLFPGSSGLSIILPIFLSSRAQNRCCQHVYGIKHIPIKEKFMAIIPTTSFGKTAFIE